MYGQLAVGANDLAVLAVIALVSGSHRVLDRVDHGVAAAASVFKLPEHRSHCFQINHMECVCVGKLSTTDTPVV